MIAGAVVAATLVALGGVAPVVAVPPADHTIVITHAGHQSLPEQWFADAVVLPGDSGERTITLKNSRSVATTVTVGLSDGEQRSGTGVFAELDLHWGGGEGKLGDVAATSPTVVDEVVLNPGESIPVTLGYRFDEDAERIVSGSVTSDFLIVLNAVDTYDTDTDGGTGAGSGANGGSNGNGFGGLASTGGNVSGPWFIGLLSLVAGWFLFASRRRRDAARG